MSIFLRSMEKHVGGKVGSTVLFQEMRGKIERKIIVWSTSKGDKISEVKLSQRKTASKRLSIISNLAY